MNLSDRDKRAVKAGAALLIAIFVVKFAVMPLAASWLDARQTISQTNESLQTVEVKLQHLERLTKQLGPAINQPLQDIETTQIRFHQSVQSLLKKAGVGYESIQPQATIRLRKITGVSSIPIQIRGKCKVKQFANLLALINQHSSLIIVDSINLVSNPKKPGNLDVTLVLSTLAKGGNAR